MQQVKWNIYPRENVTDWSSAILLDAEHIESYGDLKHENLGYIICTFEDTSDTRFRLWAIQKYKEATEFIK